MYICIYVCMYVYMYRCIDAYMYICIYVYTRVDPRIICAGSLLRPACSKAGALGQLRYLFRCFFVPVSTLLRHFFDVSSFHLRCFRVLFFDILDPEVPPSRLRKHAIFDPTLTPKTPPNGAQMASKRLLGPRRPPRTILDPLRTPSRTPLGPQVGPKSAPSRPEDASRGAKTASK